MELDFKDFNIYSLYPCYGICRMIKYINGKYQRFTQFKISEEEENIINE